MKRRSVSLCATLKLNFVLACITAFVMLAMYSLDYASQPCSDLCKIIKKAEAEHEQQMAFLREWSQ